MIKKLLLTYTLLVSFLFSQDLKVVHMEGTYDLDGDGLKEFATVESGSIGGKQISVIRYYEVDESGYQEVSWEFEAPDGVLGNFVDVELGDLDGDGSPELITVSNITDGDDDELLQPVVFYYFWDGAQFSEEPGGVLNLSDGKSFVRAQNFTLMDYDGDMDQELAVSLGSPLRQIIILGIDDVGDWVEIETLKPNGMRSGAGSISVTAVDWNKDGYDDLIASSVEGSVLKTQPFYNTGNDLLAGKGEKLSLPGLDGLIPISISTLDWNKDGYTDVVLPFQNGDLISMTLFGDMIDIQKMQIDGGPLSNIRITDFNQDSYDDLLLVSGDMNVLSVVYGDIGGMSGPSEYFTIEEAGEKEAQVFTALPVSTQGIYTGTVIAAGWDGYESTLFMIEIGKGPEPIRPDDVAADIPDETVDVYPDISTEEIITTEVPTPLETMAQPLPDGILPRHVLTVNQAFAYTLPEEEKKEFYSFRWLQPPPNGMFFHYDSRSIRWVPDESQLGAYKIAYNVERKLGETVTPSISKEDTLLTYKVVPDLEGDDERLWIYVNDPPMIVSEPQGTEFVGGESFVYKPVVMDRNVDKKLKLELESSPQGMRIENNEFIVWDTDSSHIDIYEIRLIASDGFDRSVQNFSLFARAGVKILSVADKEAEVDKGYRYKVDIWRPDLEHILDFSLTQGPDGMTIDKTGLVNWTPSTTQIDSQSFTVKVNHGVAVDSQTVTIYVNYPPIIRSAPLKMNVINLGEEYRFALDVFDPNKDDDLVFTANEMPDGMRMDPYEGMIVWEPARENIDFSRLNLTVSDGRTERTIVAEYYVNAPINIVSIPQMQGSVDEEYNHQIITSDMNKDALLPYDEVIPLKSAQNYRIYSIQISDDVYIENIDRYLMDWNNAESVYLTEQDALDSLSIEVSRLNLKKYVDYIFYEDDRLNIIVESIDDRTVPIKDILWEFFQGNKGRPPKVVARKMSPIKYTLLEFPDGMEIDEYTGVIRWTPTIDQVDRQKVSYMVSDGYTKDEQTYEIYVNHQPVIVSSPPVTALVGEVFKYNILVEDKNEDADLLFTLTKGPQGMQISKKGKVVWIPKSAQINESKFTYEVSDGYSSDKQEGKIFVNINPNIISTPRPVALTGHQYKYRVVAEDLNKDRIAYKAVKLPKYSTFSKKTGMLDWKPRPSQRGPNDIVLVAIDERGAMTSHEFQIHVFEDPSARRMINAGWPLMLSFVGAMFAWGMAQI